MKKFRLWLRIFCLILAVTFICTPTIEANAAAKAVKVTGKTTYSGSKQYTVLKGKSSSGKVVWTYKSRSAAPTELTSFSYKVSGDYIYCIDQKQYLRIRKSTGKVVVKKNLPSSVNLGSAAIYVDSSKNMYVMGYYGSVLYKINAKGKVVWSKAAPSQYYWPYKITKSGSKVVVYYEMGPSATNKITFRMSNGAIVQ